VGRLSKVGSNGSQAGFPRDAHRIPICRVHRCRTLLTNNLRGFETFAVPCSSIIKIMDVQSRDRWSCTSDSAPSEARKRGSGGGSLTKVQWLGTKGRSDLDGASGVHHITAPR
jgi:hypothetical protein